VYISSSQQEIYELVKRMTVRLNPWIIW